MLNCLHLLNCYLGISETFVWNYLRSADRFRPIILAGGFDNLSTFPLESAVFIPSHPQKRLFESIKARLKGTFAEDDYSPCFSDLDKRSVDIIHAHYGYRAIVSLSLVERIKRPLVTSFYGYDLSHQNFLTRASEGYQNLFERGDAFLVEGTSSRNRLHKLGCPWDKIHIQKIALQLSRYNFREREWNGDRTIRFLFIGRLVPKKGLSTGLEALARVDRHHENWTLTVIGDGPMRGKWSRLCEKLEIENRVQFKGKIPPEHLPDLYDTHDILLQPSHTADDGDGEGGAPTVLLEAQASGMPIISTLHDDIPNVVKEGHNAILSEERDVAQMAVNIRKILDDHKRWPEMGRCGLAHMKEHHDVSKAVQQLEKLYFSILS